MEDILKAFPMDDGLRYKGKSFYSFASDAFV